MEKIFKQLRAVENGLSEQSQMVTPSVLALREMCEGVRSAIRMIENAKQPEVMPAFEVAERVVKARMQSELAKFTPEVGAYCPRIQLKVLRFTGDTNPEPMWEVKSHLTEGDDCSSVSLDEAIAKAPPKSHEQIRAEKIAKLKAELAELETPPTL